MRRVYLFAILSLVLFLNGVVAQESKPILTHETALKIQREAVSYAADNDLIVAVSVYDTHGRLISFVRMDGASVGVSKLARWKGKSAASYRRLTSDTAKWNIETAPDIAIAEGGVPIFNANGYPLGGVGVSGASSADDVKCGLAGIKSVGLTSVKKED